MAQGADLVALLEDADASDMEIDEFLHFCGLFRGRGTDWMTMIRSGMKIWWG